MVLSTDMDVFRGSVKEAVRSTIPVVSAAIIMPQEANRDEKFWGLAPSSPGAGSLHSVASIDTVTSTENSINKPEKWWSTTLQVAVPFFLAGIGTIAAGLTLGVVQVSSLVC